MKQQNGFAIFIQAHENFVKNESKSHTNSLHSQVNVISEKLKNHTFFSLNLFELYSSSSLRFFFFAHIIH